MSQLILDTFARKNTEGKAVFVAFLPSGYPTVHDTVPILLALQDAGAAIIELSIPHSDPLADGPVIQEASNVSLANGVTTQTCLEYVRQARAAGLHVPVVFMGYYNPLRAYGQARIVADAKQAGANGFIIVDLPPEECSDFRQLCRSEGLSYIPLIAPTTTDERLAYIDTVADSFVYCVSVLGVTGARTKISDELPGFVQRARAHIRSPLAIGFGVADSETCAAMAQLGDGVVVGSALVKALGAAQAAGSSPAEAARQLVSALAASAVRPAQPAADKLVAKTAPAPADDTWRLPSEFGRFGGRYVPETLVGALDELERAYSAARADPAFRQQLESHYAFIGRPTPVHKADRLSQLTPGGAQIWLKREDLAHTGAHKINNAVGQVLLALRLGKTRIIAETGAGQHGVATATVCAKFGLECVVYMGVDDIERQSLNVFRMKILGATVVPVSSGSRTLKDAINEAMRDWVANIRTTHYLVGSAIGPHPFPTIVRDFQSVIGREARAQMIESSGRLPDVVVACVGGGSNAIGMFHPFVPDAQVRIVGAEAAGLGMHTGQHCATLVNGTIGVLHGTRTLLLQDGDGQISATHSVSAGLDYPGVGPEHSFLKESGRVDYQGVTDDQALQAFKQTTALEGIMPALESSHALYLAIQLASKLDASKTVLVCVSGRGDKDIGTVAKLQGITLSL
eukprot:TRINITY_DN10037_c0_g1_i1.p1 TRINITY_DN10037_c0_g1~~TRINITY_DN10037_c0_g1_i1.p1  ORF type:complete len:685 (-),score=255.47 TRINITY_DN10037_c0_g1_i1:136-2190(-)